MVVGTAAALVISMLIELSLKAEGLPDGRRALRNAATLQLCLAAPLAAFATGFVTARRYAPAMPEVSRRRRYTLRQLFIGQLIVGLLLGWWAFTRRDEIGKRRDELEWQVRDRQMKAIFEPYGWKVHTWPGYDEMALLSPEVFVSSSGPTFQQPVHDDTLKLVAIHAPVTQLIVSSDAVTDAGPKHLADAKRLRRLWIASRQITDDGVAELCELPRLRYLEIHSPQLTKASLDRLARVKSLRYLVLSTALITPEEQKAFRQARPDVNLRFVAGETPFSAEEK
jgi:hypothetical protein